jgi:hypothetical protein
VPITFGSDFPLRVDAVEKGLVIICEL